MENKRSYVEVSPELQYQLKVKAATERTNVRELVARAILNTYPELTKTGEEDGRTIL